MTRYRKTGQNKVRKIDDLQTNHEAKEEYDYMMENRKLHKQLEEMKKENLLLKKSNGILCEGNRLAFYRFIRNNSKTFGVNWLLRRFNIYSNAYYNYLKDRKSGYRLQKARIHNKISRIYHDNNGVLGYSTVRVFLNRKKTYLGTTTVYKYMNKELGLMSVIRRKKPNYRKGKTHKVFPNLLQQDFNAEKSTPSGVPTLHISILQTAEYATIAPLLTCTTEVL